MIASKPVCTGCDVERRPTISVPITQEYVITTYECPQCKGVLRLVEDRPTIAVGNADGHADTRPLPPHSLQGSG